MATVIPHWLTKQAQLAPEQEAIKVHQKESYTFLQLKEKSESFARKLATLKVKEGSKVAILSTNTIEMVIAIHALSYLKAVAVLLNTRLTKSELTYQINEADVSLLISTDDLIKEKNLDFSYIYSFSQVQDEDEKQDIKLQVELNLDDPFTLMFTSGTTGHPKAVLHTYGNHWWSAIGSALNLGIDKDDNWLATLPLFHVGGLSILMRSVIYGMSVYLFESYDREGIHESIMKGDVTIASLVTLMLRNLLDDLGDDHYPPSLRCLLLGGGSIDEGLLQRVKEKELPVFQSYGMTETSSQIVTLSQEDALRKLGSAGKALFPAQVKIMNQNDEGIGDIFVKGPMVIHGYMRNDETNEKSFIDGWLKTGDLGYIDEDGFLFVLDRRSDLIISGGENIYPSEIEEQLLAIEGIKEAAVVGKKHDKWGAVPLAFVVCTDLALTSEEIIGKLKKSLASYKVPSDIHFIKELPKTASNKIKRHELLDLL